MFFESLISQRVVQSAYEHLVPNGCIRLVLQLSRFPIMPLLIKVFVTALLRQTAACTFTGGRPFIRTPLLLLRCVSHPIVTIFILILLLPLALLLLLQLSLVIRVVLVRLRVMAFALVFAAISSGARSRLPTCTAEVLCVLCYVLWALLIEHNVVHGTLALLLFAGLQLLLGVKGRLASLAEQLVVPPRLVAH